MRDTDRTQISQFYFVYTSELCRYPQFATVVEKQNGPHTVSLFYICECEIHVTCLVISIYIHRMCI